MISESHRRLLETCPLAVAAKRDAKGTAVVHGQGSISFEEFDQHVSRVGAALRAMGVVSGSRVALAAESSVQLLAAILALLRTGASAVILPTRYPADALAGLAEQTRCTLAVVDRHDRLPVEKGSLLVHRLPDLVNPATGQHRDRAWRWEPDGIATIVCTSGSTGKSRQVALSWRNHYYSALGASRHMPLTSEDRWLLSLPLYHVAGLGIVFRCLLAGAAIAIPDNPHDLCGEASKHRATHLSLVPTQLRRLLADKGKAPASVKEILVGGGSVATALLEQARVLTATVRTTYGLTEMASQVTTSSGTVDDVTTSGAVLPYRSVSIGEHSEVLVRGETLFLGYVVEGGLELPLDRRGWYRTGDRGYLDAKGRLTVLGRLDNMFVSGGENIFPEEIERMLDNVDGISRSAVVDVPDIEYGARPVAFVEYERDAVSDEEVRAVLGRLLPRFKLPDAILPFPASVTANLDKINRQELRRIAYTRLRGNGLSRPGPHR